ncbi:MAG: serine protease [Pseudomonadota bacterium]
MYAETIARLFRQVGGCISILVILATGTSSRAADFVQTIAAVKPAVVGIATMQKLRSPSVLFYGTGFAINDGLTIVTNAHVVSPLVADLEKSGELGILAGNGQTAGFRPAVIVAIDKEHDLALLRISGEPLRTLALGDSTDVREGQEMAFTGFPLGMVLGFHHATHRAMISAITPILQPAPNSRRLDAKAITQIQKSAYGVFQLDGTAYPGNSGSPLYDPVSGIVYGVINMVFIKGMKESAISQPSGITYAIQSNHIRALLKNQKD